MNDEVIKSLYYYLALTNCFKHYQKTYSVLVMRNWLSSWHRFQSSEPIREAHPLPFQLAHTT